MLDQDWLQARVLKLIEDDEQIEPDENLIFYGLDSIGVMALSSELKSHGIEISFEELASAPTLTAWWAMIDARQAAA